MALDHSCDDELRLAVHRAFSHYATRELIGLLRDRSPIVRAAAAQQLHIRGGYQVFSEAVKLATEPQPESREVAGFLLGQLGTPNCAFADESFPILLQLIRDKDVDVSHSAVAAVGALGSLGRQPPVEIICAIVDLSNSTDNAARFVAAGMLGFIDGQLALKALERLSKDKSRRIAAEARWSKGIHLDRAKGQ